MADQIERDKTTLKEEIKNAVLANVMGFIGVCLAPFLVIAPIASDSFSNWAEGFVIFALGVLFCWGGYWIGTREVRRLKRRIRDLEQALEMELGLSTG